MDTCCIDKANFSELSEEINSMFRYYADAQICYTYLADVDKVLYKLEPPPIEGRVSWLPIFPHLNDTFYVKLQFVQSRWFKRGWTLQELLAPKFLLFLNKSRVRLGDREQWITEVSEASGISINHIKDLRSACVATILSWASHRETQKIEDRAYSLLGLLDVNMPLIYGEEHKAFERLQREIIRTSTDETVFSWGEDFSTFRIRILLFIKPNTELNRGCRRPFRTKTERL